MKRNPIFSIKKSKIDPWGYEFWCKSLHYRNTAPSVEAARKAILARFGHDVTIIERD